MDFSNQTISKEYKQKAPVVTESNWYDLSDGTNVLLRRFPNKLTKLGKGNLITIKRLKSIFGNDKKLNKEIVGIKPAQNKSIFKINFPIKLKTKDYVRLFALMRSEGSYRTEFSLNVPEKDFHDIFSKTLSNLISKNVKIKIDKNKGVKRSRAPAVLRYILPFYRHLPDLLFANRSFAEEYLRIAFEAEGSPIFNPRRSKKYIKLSRNTDATRFFQENHQLPEGRRLFVKELEDKYPSCFKKILKYPCITLLGEHLLLKEHFDINSTLKFESIRLNKIDNRCGRISAKWVLYIYAEDVNKFIKKIGFISSTKNTICRKMKKIPSRRPQYSSLRLMKELQKGNIFSTKEFVDRMNELGYKSPGKFLWDYSKNKNIIKRIGRGKYRILI
jgi:hypothetical protein